ncbi:MAG: hypothetical protein NZ896_03990 [Nitrososphaerales archaeon]|nr:hypothetical protein [Nitrososphaerales archaeon]
MKPKDRDFIKTKEGFFFCVIGYTHPKDRIISYIRYVPKEGGRWAGKYDRMMPSYNMPNLIRNLDFLRAEYPHYFYESKVFDTTISAVPYSFIQQYYHPDEKVQRLVKEERRDRLQDACIKLITILSEGTKIPITKFGLTGSVLIDIHHPILSDIDIIIYGYKNALRLKEFVKSLYNEDRYIKRLSKDRLEAWCRDKSSSHPFTIDEARRLYDRKWNYGTFEDYAFSIHPVKSDDEIFEEYGDRSFIGEGMVRVEGEVCDNREAIFLPYTYHVENVSVKEGKRVDDIREVTSYESLYGDILSIGEKFVAYGRLERVLDRKVGEEYHRVLIGSLEANGRDYIKPKDL